jgi:hypothetical protein
MDTYARTVYLVPLTGQAIEYVVAEELREGLAVFGPAYPVPWRPGRLLHLVPQDGQPAVLMAVPNELMGAVLGESEQMFPFAALHAIRLAPQW